MFRTEMYRIFSRKAAIAALAAVLLITFFYGRSAVWAEWLIDRGEVYYKEEAIKKDREAAGEFTGILTEEAVRAIWEKYGSPVDVLSRARIGSVIGVKLAEGRSENCCNRLVADLFARGIEKDGVRVYELEENLSENQYLQGDYYFGYTGNGWSGYWDVFLIVYVLACITVVILLAPTFAEDYMCRAADIILPTANGRSRLWAVRTAAGCGAASVYYWLVCGTMFLWMCAGYGTEGLKVSCRLAGVPMFFPEGYRPVWQAVLTLHLCGWAGVLTLAVLVQGISARSKSSFSALVKSLLAYLGPFALMRMVLETLMKGQVGALLHYLCYGMPFSYPGTFLESPWSTRLLITGVLLAAAAAGAGLGVSGYCGHQAGVSR